jgi:hypothetical protein
MSIDPDETPHAKAFWEEHSRQTSKSAARAARAVRDRVEHAVEEAADALSAKAADITRRNAAGAHLTPEEQISEMSAAIAATGFPADEVLAALGRATPDPYARSADVPGTATEVSALVAMGATPEEAHAILADRRREAATQAERDLTHCRTGQPHDWHELEPSGSAPADVCTRCDARRLRIPAVLAAMRPGVVITAKHRDPKECGGVEHRWMVLHSGYGRGPSVVNESGVLWALSSLDPATIRVVAW